MPKSSLSRSGTRLRKFSITLRQQIAQACDEIKASLDKNGFLKGKVSERAAGLVELYDLMAAHNDKELRENWLSCGPRSGPLAMPGLREPARSPEAIKDTLTDIINMANLEASELANLSRAAFWRFDKPTSITNLMDYCRHISRLTPPYLSIK